MEFKEFLWQLIGIINTLFLAAHKFLKIAIAHHRRVALMLEARWLGENGALLSGTTSTPAFVEVVGHTRDDIRSTVSGNDNSMCTEDEIPPPLEFKDPTLTDNNRPKAIEDIVAKVDDILAQLAATMYPNAVDKDL